MLETISLIVSVASGILTALQSAKDLRLSGIHKSSIYLFLDEMANLLDTVVVKFKAGEVPHGACEELRIYSQNMSLLHDVIPAEQVVDFSNKLLYAHNIELLHMSVSKDPSQLIELEKAAATFRAASRLMKLT